MKIIGKTRKIGGSLVVTIPKIVVEEENLRPDQAVKLDIQKLRKSGFGIFPKLNSFSKEDKFYGQLE